MKFPDGIITVTGANGASFVQEKTPNDIIFTDKNGKQYTVAANAPAGPIESSGQVAPGGIPTPKNTNGMGSGGVVAEISSPDVSVVFTNGDGKYAFDTAPTTQNGKLNKTYASLPQKSGGTYNVPFKAISNSPYEKDVIVATVDFKNGKTKKDLVFKTQNGTAIDSTQITWNGNVATLTLRKTLDFAKETVIAMVRPAASKDPKEAAGKYDIAGTFDLWHLSNKKVNVTLVSVNGATLPNNAEKQLNEIYEPAGVTFVVNTTNISLDNSWGESIQTSESGLLATYTNEQQQITTNLQQKLGATYKKDTYYIIYTDAPSDKSNILGFMPLKRQYGFVFNKINTIRTLAHELGHGVFGLEHPFTEYNTTTTTDLLMDYGTGLALNHNDWQVIHAPGLQLYPFIQGDSDGELAGGYALAPDWSFVSNGDETTVKASGDTDTKGFLRGITTKKGTYIWKLKDGKYNYLHETTNKIYENPKVSPNANSTIWLFFENQNSRGKYIRTKYSVVEAIIKSKNETNLSKFIEKNRAKDLYTKGKDENRTTYWGYVGCGNCDSNGVENGTGSDGLIVDFNKVFTNDQLTRFREKLVEIKTETGLDGKVLVTKNENSDDINKAKEILAQLKQKNTKEVYVWANYTSSNSFDLQVAYSKGFSNSEKQAFEKVIQAANKNKEGLIQLGIQGEKFNPLTAIFDGLASIIRKAKIPERFYNPEIKTGDYNPILYYISLADPYALGTLLNDKQLQMLNINITNSNKVGTSHIYFAVKCGVWNGIVDQVAGLSDTAGIISDLFSGGDRISELWTGLKKLDIWCTETQGPNNVCIWSLIKKAHTGQTCQVAEQVGVDAANVLTIAISFAKIGQVAKVAQLMESLDAMSQVLKLTSKVIKPVLVGTGKATKIVFKVTKAFLQPGVKFTKLNGRLFSVLIPIPIDLTPNLEAAINKAKELLAKNKDGFDLEVQLKKDAQGVEIKDQNGNLVGEIEVDGQKIEVLVNPDENKLKESAEEILQGAGNLPSLIRQLVSKPSFKPLRTIWSKQNNTTTFIGKWDELVNGQQNGLQKVYDELSQSDLNIYMQSGKFDHPGGFNMLSIDNFPAKQAEYAQKLSAGQINSSWSFDDYIWEAYNKPWLESALQRGDEIIIWSDPINSRTGFYKRELDFIQTKASQYGYDYNTGISSGAFSK